LTILQILALRVRLLSYTIPFTHYFTPKPASVARWRFSKPKLRGFGVLEVVWHFLAFLAFFWLFRYCLTFLKKWLFWLFSGFFQHI
jgi:hypothetical protein